MSQTVDPACSWRDAIVAVGVLLPFALFTAIFLGFYRAQTYFSDPHVRYALNVDDRVRLLLLGGDRGVLFYDTQKKIVIFLKWNDIRTIDRTENE